MKRFSGLMITSIFLVTTNNLGFYQNTIFSDAKAETPINIFVKPKKVLNKSEVKNKTIQKNIATTKQINSNNVSVEKIKWYSFDEGMKLSKETNKYLFIDFYATWCPPCKNLEKITYSNEKIIKYMNEKFIPIKIDAESNDKIVFEGVTYTEKELASNFIVQAYPSMFFMKNNEVVLKIQGFLDVPDFYNYISFIGSEAFKNQNFERYKQVNKI